MHSPKMFYGRRKREEIGKYRLAMAMWKERESEEREERRKEERRRLEGRRREGRANIPLYDGLG